MVKNECYYSSFSHIWIESSVAATNEYFIIHRAIYGFKATIHGKLLKCCGVVVRNEYCYYSFSHI